jgi:hypothetical protein
MYIKPTANFKMNKIVKNMLGSISDPEQRNGWKRAMIQAQLCGAIAPKNVKTDKTTKIQLDASE